jgi:hypothetical protein
MLIPIMFPICLLCLFNTYITEKISLIWLYRRPPMFDESLGKRAFDLLKRPPYLMFMMGYWAIGNRQIFDAMPAVKVFNNRPGDPKHPLYPHGFNQSSLCFCIFLFWFIRAFCYEFIWEKVVVPIKKCCGCKIDELGIGDLKDNEGLPQYYNAMCGNDQKAWYAQELYDRKMKGIINLDNDQMTMLRGKNETNVVGTKRIMRDPSYHILKDEIYSQVFGYMSILDRPFEDVGLMNEDGELKTEEELADLKDLDGNELKFTEEDKERGYKICMPFKTDDEGNHEF